jgi:hypothetical protein
MIESLATATHPLPSLDLSHGRKPIRLGISRQLARTRTGREKFITRIRVGKASAVLVPWRDQAQPRPRQRAGEFRAPSGRVPPLRGGEFRRSGRV